jgi:hypothetical protein
MTQEPTSPAAGPGKPANTGGGAAALQSANRLDLGIVGAGVIAFLASLMPFYTVSVKGFGGGSVNAWHGFFGWFGCLVALAAAVVLLLHLMGQALPVPVRTTVLAGFGIATVCLVLALFVFPGGGCDDAGMGICDAIDTGHGFGYWLALLASIAGTVLAFQRKDEA